MSPVQSVIHAKYVHVLTAVMNASLPDVPHPLRTTALWAGSHKMSHAVAITLSMLANVQLSYIPCVCVCVYACWGGGEISDVCVCVCV